jgi:hypothetical protein
VTGQTGGSATPASGSTTPANSGAARTPQATNPLTGGGPGPGFKPGG